MAKQVFGGETLSERSKAVLADLDDVTDERLSVAVVVNPRRAKPDRLPHPPNDSSATTRSVLSKALMALTLKPERSGPPGPYRQPEIRPVDISRDCGGRVRQA